MQRCPAVPTAPKTIEGMAISRSAESETITALLPPSSRMVLPKRFPTISPTRFPTAVDPVTENRGIRLSAKKLSPKTDDLAITKLNTPSGTSFCFSTF